jgi:hypothetical protein
MRVNEAAAGRSEKKAKRLAQFSRFCTEKREKSENKQGHNIPWHLR